MREEQIMAMAAQRLGIATLNDMQRCALEAWRRGGDLVLYSPTGSGKTLAFALCLLLSLEPPAGRLQAVVVAPTRELVMQTAQVLRLLATGHKVTACCGGHDAGDEKASLAVTPGIVVATPGRLLDHARRGHIDLGVARLLVLDEVDKALELGFEDEMRRLLALMPRVERRIMASATVLDPVPGYARLHDPVTLNVLGNMAPPSQRIATWRVEAGGNDRLECLHRLLLSLDGGKAIVFANRRESVERIHQYLAARGVDAAIYHGTLDQRVREQAVSMLAGGSVTVLVATDLASRGLDIAAVDHIIHYHLPVSERAYVHRNGRTARAGATGNAYVITAPGEALPAWVPAARPFALRPAATMPPAPMATLYFQAGRKEKLSRGDIMGAIVAAGGIDPGQVGRIDVRDHYSLAAVPRREAPQVLQRLQQARVKGKKVRISLLR